MAQIDERTDAVLEEAVDVTVVEIQPLGVCLPRPSRDHTRPGCREPIALHAELLHQRDVVRVAVVAIDRDAGIPAAFDLAGTVHNTSQLEMLLPPSRQAPSVWKEEEAQPQTKPLGNRSSLEVFLLFIGGLIVRDDLAACHTPATRLPRAGCIARGSC